MWHPFPLPFLFIFVARGSNAMVRRSLCKEITEYQTVACNVQRKRQFKKRTPLHFPFFSSRGGVEKRKLVAWPRLPCLSAPHVSNGSQLGSIGSIVPHGSQLADRPGIWGARPGIQLGPMCGAKARQARHHQTGASLELAGWSQGILHCMKLC